MLKVCKWEYCLYEGQMVTGVIIKADGYKPSADGVTIYLNGGDNLQIILDKVEKNGGKIISPKTAHADGSGFFAIFIDSEGNKWHLIHQTNRRTKERTHNMVLAKSRAEVRTSAFVLL